MNSTKILSISATLLLSASAFAAFQLYSHVSLQAEQIASYESFVSDLQAELDSTAQERVEYESRLAEMGRELVSAQEAIRGLNDELELAREQINPDVYLMEQEIRERVIREVVQEAERTPSRYEISEQLSRLDPEEMRQVMSMQGRYGEFLSALDVSEGRKEVIVDALINMMTDQDQQRRELIAQNAGNQQGRRELRREMLAISSPDAQVEALSYVLDDNEMAAFESFQEEQREQRRTTSTSFISGSARGPVRVNETTTTDANGQIETRIIEMVTPDDQPN
ncbi:MAG: hypothetical protein ISP88_08625 [Pseudomonadales bacterium]|jgi:uncharacterized protein YeeX (DUF496 family)|nr:hypothetical protein [Pseudomonadales bacterium]